MMSEDDVLRVHCRACGHPARHRIVADEVVTGPDLDGAAYLWDTYEIVRCEGCGTISFRHSWVRAATSDPDSEVLGTHLQVYPESKSGRQPMAGAESLPEATRQVYMEVLRALDAGLLLLAAMGLRTVVESVCRDRAGEFRTLQEGIERLGAFGIISIDQEQYLHAQRFLGNDATHRFAAPTAREIAAALEITETMLRAIYVLPELAKEVGRSSRPPVA